MAFIPYKPFLKHSNIIGSVMQSCIPFPFSMHAMILSEHIRAVMHKLSSYMAAPAFSAFSSLILRLDGSMYCEQYLSNTLFIFSFRVSLLSNDERGVSLPNIPLNTAKSLFN